MNVTEMAGKSNGRACTTSQKPHHHLSSLSHPSKATGDVVQSQRWCHACDGIIGRLALPALAPLGMKLLNNANGNDRIQPPRVAKIQHYRQSYMTHSIIFQPPSSPQRVLTHFHGPITNAMVRTLTPPLPSPNIAGPITQAKAYTTSSPPLLFPHRFSSHRISFPYTSPSACRYQAPGPYIPFCSLSRLTCNN